MLAIGIEDQRPLWEMKAGSGVGGGGQYKADPTLAPRAPVGDTEKYWAGGIAEAGGKKEGKLVPESGRRIKRSEENPENCHLGRSTLEVTLSVTTEDDSQGSSTRLRWGVKEPGWAKNRHREPQTLEQQGWGGMGWGGVQALGA